MLRLFEKNGIDWLGEALVQGGGQVDGRLGSVHDLGPDVVHRVLHFVSERETLELIIIVVQRLSVHLGKV